MKLFSRIAVGVIFSCGIIAQNSHAETVCVARGGVLKVVSRGKCPAKTRLFPLLGDG